MSQVDEKRDGATGGVDVQAFAQTAASTPEALTKALTENAESVGRAIGVLGRMEREGSLDELADLLVLVRLVKSALTDEMVISAARRIERLAAVATDPVLTGLLSRLPVALQAAQADADQAAMERPSLMSLVRLLRDPQVYRGLMWVLSLVKHLAPEAPESR